jgi:hypothetical protein
MDYQKNKPKFKQNDLFKGDRSQFRLNACVGTNGGPYNFYDYGKGYFLASRKLVDNLKIESQRIDILVYPICFMFRHGIELYLKHFMDVLPPIWNSKEIIKPTHKLMDNWERVKSYLIKRKDFDTENIFIPQVEKILKEFLEIDDSGQVFRYPINNKGALHLEETRLINLLVLGKIMDEAEKIFEFWDITAEQLMEIKFEYSG